MDVHEALRERIRSDLEDDGVDCPRCDSRSFEVEVWGVSDEREEPRGAAVCEDCGARLNVRVTADDIDELT